MISKEKLKTMKYLKKEYEVLQNDSILGLHLDAQLD